MRHLSVKNPLKMKQFQHDLNYKSLLIQKEMVYTMMARKIHNDKNNIVPFHYGCSNRDTHRQEFVQWSLHKLTTQGIRGSLMGKAHTYCRGSSAK